MEKCVCGTMNVSGLFSQHTCEMGGYVQTATPMFDYHVPVVYTANPGVGTPMTPKLLRRYGLWGNSDHIAAVIINCYGSNIQRAAIAADDWCFEAFRVIVRVPPINKLPSFNTHDGNFGGLLPADCYAAEKEDLLYPTRPFLDALQRYMKVESKAIVQPDDLGKCVMSSVHDVRERIQAI